MLYFIGLPLLALAIAGFYYLFFMRICKTFGWSEKRKALVRIIVVVLSAGIAALCVFRLTVAIWTLHIIAVAFVMLLVNFTVKMIGGERYRNGCKPWKVIYGGGFIPLALATAVIIGGYINMMNVVETRYTVYTDKAIREEGYRVVLIADVHYGVSIGGKEMRRVCDEISGKQPDIVVLCGDIVDENTSKAGMEEVFAALGSIDTELGVYYVYGNHDRQDYATQRTFTESELVQTMEDNGIVVLSDTAIAVNDEFTVVGREDLSRGGESGRAPIAELLKSVDETDFILTLDHQPREYKENGEAGTDLLLSGHTHNGQVWPMNWLFRLNRRNDALYGYTRIDANAQAFVTAGFAGWGFTVKTSAPAEYVTIDIYPNAALGGMSIQMDTIN